LNNCVHSGAPFGGADRKAGRKIGYTHYWELSNISQHSARWKTVIIDMSKIIAVSPVLLGDACGFNAPSISATEVLFNGRHENDQDHETFHFPGEGGFNFCKTASKPYDIVVTACLAAAKDIFGSEISVGSDGDPEDWVAGVALAEYVLGRSIANPIKDERA